MTDIDHDIWEVVVNTIGTELNMNTSEEDIVIIINRLTHGLIDQYDILREIQRQKRSVIN